MLMLSTRPLSPSANAKQEKTKLQQNTEHETCDTMNKLRQEEKGKETSKRSVGVGPRVRMIRHLMLQCWQWIYDDVDEYAVSTMQRDDVSRLSHWTLFMSLYILSMQVTGRV